MRRNRLLVLVGLASAASFAWASLAPVAEATGTRSFVLDDAASLAAGELERTAVHSDGRVTTGVELSRVALPEDVALAWSWARGADGALYLGTGNDGRIYRVRGDAVERFAETGQLLVASLAFGDGGTLYAGTLPEGRIYAIDAAGAVREVARPDGVEHVWALAWDARRRTLFAATGPEGRVYAIDPSGRADVYWDSTAGHVMCLALAPDGALYAGTSDEAIVARITAPGRAEVVHDFPGNEVTAISFAGGRLAVGANEFPDPPSVSSSGSTGSTKRSTSSRASRPRPGTGRIFAVGADGRVEQLHEQREGHVTAIQIADDGTVYAGLGAEGRVLRVTPDHRSAVWIDVDERQVLALDLTSSSPFLATGDGAAIYRVGSGPPRTATWMSKVLDASFAARWGQLTWRGRGAVELQTRSGNTERPDETWSEWSTSMTSAGPIRSPGARFLQLRAVFDRAPDAEILAVIAYYLPQNQRAVVTEVALKARSTKRSGGEPIDPHAPPPPTPMLGLTWKVENTDTDRLRYRVRFREETQSIWREITREHEVVTGTEHTWDTSAIPDGWYVVRVEASDELANPEGLTLTGTGESEPLLVDNHAPVVSELRATGARVSGRAVDALGPVAVLEVAIDGGEWRPFFPADDLLDTRDERFDLDLGALAGGPHIVAIRATDAAGNVGSAEITVTVPGGAAAPAAGGRARRPAR